ncbi:mitogen-activated protein kinase 15 [Spatholobus suberectus]|nr:mitogen-activated protein kinase 15 [Spatholobus suberectus]
MNDQSGSREETKGWRKVMKSVINWLAYKDENEWLKDMRGNLSLVATVIATMTFQSAINPPGGVWLKNISDSLLGTLDVRFIFSCLSLASKWVSHESPIFHLAFVSCGCGRDHPRWLVLNQNDRVWNSYFYLDFTASNRRYYPFPTPIGLDT